MQSEFRAPTTRERLLFGRIGTLTFKGRDEIVAQIDSCAVRTIDDNGSLAIQSLRRHPAKVSARVPVEGEVADSDGVIIHVLLHVVDGFATEIQYYKEDGSSIDVVPDVSAIEFFAY